MAVRDLWRIWLAHLFPQQRRKSSSLKETSPIGLSIDFNNADALREPLSPLQVFVASGRILLDTPIRTAAAAMASTLERAYLSIYNWPIFFGSYWDRE
uniref:Uncharacterized protein n=1 Tax=Hordeum vulgare subsp. vulgare TaxID=112509 RepID=A0A023INK1_HORVV|nr:hypothetical protein [Hordeum vulgare subsp. vulgare]